MLAFVRRTTNFSEYLKHRRTERKNGEFFQWYSHLAHIHISKYPTKYIAGLVFDGDTGRVILEGTPEREDFETAIDYMRSLGLVRGAAVDAGAHSGMVSIFLAEFYQEVFAFEPHPMVFKILSFNVENNDTSGNITALNVGLSSNEQQLVLQDHKERNAGGSTFESLAGYATINSGHRFVCSVSRLDQVPEISGKEIGLIKIDVEGHELSMLRGAENLIKSQRPVIIMEDWQSRNGERSDAVKLLEMWGYENFLVPAMEPSRSRARSLIVRIIEDFVGLIRVMVRGREFGLAPCDFSSPKGYSMLIAHS